MFRGTAFRGVVCLALLTLLVSCGNQQAPLQQPEATPTMVVAAATTATKPPAPTVVSPATTATSESVVESSMFAGLEQGTTPEGYHTLGNPTAPVSLVMYSDFL